MHPKYAGKILSNGALSLYLTHPLGDMPYINGPPFDKILPAYLGCMEYLFKSNFQ